VPEGLFVGVGLVVNLGPVALVGAEHYREGGEFRPAHEQLLCTVVLEKGAVYRGVATDIRVLEGVAGEPTREQARHGAPYAVVLVPLTTHYYYAHAAGMVFTARLSAEEVPQVEVALI
jgi:hypothetical protein